MENKCPHCGRSNQPQISPWPIYPRYPYYTQPYYNNQPYSYSYGISTAAGNYA